MEPLDDLLRVASPLVPDPISRRRLLDETTRELRRQRRRRRFSSIGSLVGAYAAGILTVFALHPPPMPVEHERSVAARPIRVMDSVVDLEWRALDEPAEAPVLYREAADRHLAEGDPANAVRCYGNALDSASPEATEVKDDDNWLLMAIKIARRKEAESCEH
jgi:hypothetical protein